ncbi:MAG: hypothetical protein LUQ13_01540 [Methanomicrobiales archaeon]|nr:hypothetical protein [Methanomicrobiales archaeon]
MAHKIALPMSLATGVGAVPHTDPVAACDMVLSQFPRFPFVPTLPNRGLREGIVFAESAQLPGGILHEGRLTVDTTRDHGAAIEQVYQDYLGGDVTRYGAGPEYASGLDEMLHRCLADAQTVKCQVTGPVTFGMQVTDSAKRPLLYDAEYADMLGKMLALRARWCEQVLQDRTGAKETVVVLNEPYLASIGSSVVPVDPELVRSLHEDIFSFLEGGVGIHCCSNTDWAFVLEERPSVVSFDAYANAREFLLYMDHICSYLESGGVIAWGIVPAEFQVFSTVSRDVLYEKMSAIRTAMTAHVDEDLFFQQTLVTPTCGIRFGGTGAAEQILGTAAWISSELRREYLA